MSLQGVRRRFLLAGHPSTQRILPRGPSLRRGGCRGWVMGRFEVGSRTLLDQPPAVLTTPYCKVHVSQAIEHRRGRYSREATSLHHVGPPVVVWPRTISHRCGPTRCPQDEHTATLCDPARPSPCNRGRGVCPQGGSRIASPPLRASPATRMDPLSGLASRWLSPDGSGWRKILRGGGVAPAQGPRLDPPSHRGSRLPLARVRP